MARDIKWSDLKKNPNPDDVRYLLDRGQVPADKVPEIRAWLAKKDAAGDGGEEEVVATDGATDGGPEPEPPVEPEGNDAEPAKSAAKKS